jgi:hypothetical protein
VYVGIDEDIRSGHSKDAVPGSHMTDLPGGRDWMIRAHLSPTPKGDVLHLLGKKEREKEHKAEIAGYEARLLKGAESKALNYDDGEMDAYHSYGGSTARL